MEDTSSQIAPSIGIRLLAHAFLAVFLANAANKFFVSDFDVEVQTRFYAKIFAFVGAAPDQYRILSLLPLKFLCQRLSFNHAVLVYNLFFGFVVFEMQWQLSSPLRLAWRWALSFGLAILYIYCQYRGWRPDTMGLLAVAYGSALLILHVRDRSLRMLLFGLSIVALSFCRSDIALIYALFGTFFRSKSYAVFIPIPIIAQIALQSFIFPEAVYYSKVIMLADNLSFKYILLSPGSYLLVAALLAFWRPIKAFVSESYSTNRYYYLLVIGYFFLVLIVGRVNEYRLYLPLIPLLLVITHGNKLPGRKKEASAV